MTDNDTANTKADDRRWACPGLFRMPSSADGAICRIKLDLGKINSKQLQILGQLVGDYGDGQLEVTTRGNIQIRGVKDCNSSILSQKVIAAGLGPRVKNGDDVRNIMVNPTAGIDKFATYNIVPFAEALSLYVQQHYQNLSPKFSFLIDGGEACAVLNHKSDIWLSLCDEENSFAFGLASCPTTHSSTEKALGKVAFYQGAPLIYALLDLLLTTQKSAPHIQRMKHLIDVLSREQIITWLQSHAINIQPAEDFRRPAMETHYLGIHATNQKNRYYLGVKSPFGRLSTEKIFLLAQILDQFYENNTIRFTPWQSIIFPNCAYEDAQNICEILASEDFIINRNDIRGKILCCAGAPKCAKAKSNTLADAAFMINSLEDYAIDALHLTGCPKSCAATTAQPTTLVAKSQGFYDIYSYSQDSLSKKSTDSKFGRLLAQNLDLHDITKILRKGNLNAA